MKFSLIFPRFNKNLKEFDPPLGVAYIASFLREKGKAVKIFDGTFLSEEEVIEGLKKYIPDLIGITVHSMTVENDFAFAEKIKKILPDVKIIFGGPHPTIMPEHCLDNDSVDIVVIGEGENTMFDLSNNPDNLERVDGIYYKENGKITKNKPREFIKHLDSLPFPSRDLLDIRYFRSGATIMCSRGCLFNCAFCQPTLRKIFGPLRLRSPKNIVGEIVYLIKKYKTKLILLHDDTFTANKKWAMEVCDEIIAKKLEFKWICKGRINTVDIELLQKLKEAGCTDIEFVVESGSEQIRNKILNKNISNDHIINVFKMCYDAGIKPTAFIMIGSPFETKETLNDTVELLKKIKPAHTVVSITTPMPGTFLYDMCKENDLINAKSMSEFDFVRNITIKHKYITQEDIFNTRRKIKMITYYNYGKYCIRHGKFKELVSAISRKII